MSCLLQNKFINVWDIYVHSVIFGDLPSFFRQEVNETFEVSFFEFMTNNNKVLFNIKFILFYYFICFFYLHIFESRINKQ
jgi:hypothetical protein